MGTCRQNICRYLYGHRNDLPPNQLRCVLLGRDDVHQCNNAGMPGMSPTDKMLGKTDRCMYCKTILTLDPAQATHEPSV